MSTNHIVESTVPMCPGSEHEEKSHCTVTGSDPRPSDSPSFPGGEELLNDARVFCEACSRRYHFNSRWDIALNLSGILVSIGIVASGIYRRGDISAILGATVAALVSAQKAFPFGQRANFYRTLVGQATNLRTDIEQQLVSTKEAVAILKSLRLDFAQQLPRGSTFATLDTSAGPAAPKG